MAFSSDTALQYLDRARARGHLAHAYIVSGMESADRLAFAAELACRLNGAGALDVRGMPGPGVHVVEAQSKSRAIVVDQIRALEHVIHQRAGQGKHKIGVIVEADRMNQQATNAFLKTLEEPPPDSLLLLLTGSPSQLLETVLSRCLRITLADTTEMAVELNDSQARLAAGLAAHFSKLPTPSRALSVVRLYAALLAEEKARLAGECSAEYKQEAAHWNSKTDAAAWLRQREDYFEALAQSRYLEARSRALDLVVLWLGDLIRRKSGHPRLAFPHYEALLTQAAAMLPLEDWLRRMACLEDLRRAYETNVNETLATELAFLGALG
jgi:DNA polymerase-3 subunit delta'